MLRLPGSETWGWCLPSMGLRVLIWQMGTEISLSPSRTVGRRNGGKAEPGFKPKGFVQKEDDFLPLLPWEQAVGGGGRGAPLTQPGRRHGSGEGGQVSGRGQRLGGAGRIAEGVKSRACWPGLESWPYPLPAGGHRQVPGPL